MYHIHWNIEPKEWADKAKIYYITKTKRHPSFFFKPWDQGLRGESDNMQIWREEGGVNEEERHSPVILIELPLMPVKIYSR